MNRDRKSRQRGYVLLSVVVTLVLLAAIAMFVNHGAATGANAANRQLDVRAAEYAAQAGMAHAIWLANHSSCAGDLALPTTPFGPHSYEAEIATPGGAAAVGSISSHTAAVAGDAFVQEDLPTQNFGSVGQVQALRQAATARSKRVLYRFNVAGAGIPAGSYVSSAVAKIFVVSTATDTSIHELLVPWDEGTVSWSTIGDQFGALPLASIPADAPAGQFIDVNLTAQVQAWLNDPLSNRGILLQATSEGLQSEFTSKEYGDASKRPYLEITVASGGLAGRSPASIAATGTQADGIARTLARDGVRVFNAAAPVFGALRIDGNGKDAFIEGEAGHQADINDDNSKLDTGSEPGKEFRGLMQFDLHRIPHGATVTAAELRLYVDNAGAPPDGIGVHAVTAAWTEAETSWLRRTTLDAWSRPGGDFEPDPAATFDASAEGFVSADVSGLVQSWVSGARPNHGLLLLAEPGSADNRKSFTAGDAGGDLARHPHLLVTYACECGVICSVPSGAGEVLMVVADASLPTAADAARQTLLAQWGYAVTMISDHDTATSFDDALESTNVVYVSASSQKVALGDKLDNAIVGVVSEQPQLNNALGFSTGQSTSVGETFSVTDNGHYITGIFPTGPVDLYSAAMQGAGIAGAAAPDLVTLGDWGGAATVAVLDRGAETVGGGIAAGRRVLLPLGAHDQLDLQHVNNNGRLILQRSLAWAAGGVLSSTDAIVLSTKDAAELGGLAFTDRDLVEYQPVSSSAALFLDGAAVGITKDIDALHVLENGQVVLSTTDTMTLGSVTFDKGDLVAYEPANGEVTIVFDSGSRFTSGTADITGLFVRLNERLLLANREAATLGGLAFESNDVIEYDMQTNTSTLVFDGDAAGLSASIDALHELDNGHLVFSFDDTATLDGKTFEPGDLVKLDSATGSATLYFDHALFAGNEDILSVHIGDGSGIAGGESSHSGTYLDLFQAVAFDGNDGTLDWSGDWDELGESNGPSSGRVRVVSSSRCASGHCLRIGGDEVNLDGRGVAREADLSGALTAELSFTVADSGSDGRVRLQVSADGGNDWTTLHTYEMGSSIPSTATPQSFDIAGYASGNTQIRFIGDGSTDDPAYLYIDDVRIEINGDAGAGGGGACPADVVPDSVDSEFSTSALGISDPWGIAYLAPGVTFNGNSAAGDGAWLLVDGSNREFVMTDMGGNEIDRRSIPLSEPRGAVHVGTGVWANHFAVANPAEERVYFLGTDASVQGWISTAGYTEHPVGVAFIGESASGIFDGHLVVSSDKDENGASVAGIHIVSQSGTLQLSIDTSGFSSEPWGVAHVPGEDKLLIADKSGTVYIASFDDQIQYDAGAFGANTLQSIAVNTVTGAHAVIDKDNERVLSLVSSSCGDATGACNGTFRDEFNLQSFSGNDGTLSWAGDWQETGENDGPVSGDIRVTTDQGNYQLRTRDNDNGGEGVEREADLSGAGSATLSYDYRRDLDDEGYTRVSVSSNGPSGPWTVLASHGGDEVSDGSYRSASHDIGGHISARTRIRFLTSSNMSGSDEVWFDNIEIACTP